MAQIVGKTYPVATASKRAPRKTAPKKGAAAASTAKADDAGKASNDKN